MVEIFERFTLQEATEIKHRPHDDIFSMYVENKVSSHLLIVFGSYEGKFTSTYLPHHHDLNCLFLRSNLASWYLEELPYGKTPQEVGHNINNLIASRPHIKTITTAGFSMGAFAALLYAPFLSVTKTIADAPQTNFPYWITFPQHGSKVLKPHPRAFNEFSSIRRVWDRYGQPNHHVLIRYCENMDLNEPWQDADDVSDMRHFQNLDIVPYNCTGHMAISPMFLADVKSYGRTFL